MPLVRILSVIESYSIYGHQFGFAKYLRITITYTENNVSATKLVTFNKLLTRISWTSTRKYIFISACYFSDRSYTQIQRENFPRNLLCISSTVLLQSMMSYLTNHNILWSNKEITFCTWLVLYLFRIRWVVLYPLGEARTGSSLP